uniref:WH2 domain-containing protein n=1 Tax=Heterorhabditis bacteriophora TaxID=37862 RepID=A0A1I7WN03_HETBA
MFDKENGSEVQTFPRVSAANLPKPPSPKPPPLPEKNMAVEGRSIRRHDAPIDPPPKQNNTILVLNKNNTISMLNDYFKI